MKRPDPASERPCCGLDRRQVLAAGLAAALVPAVGRAATADSSVGPAPGDRFVYLSGPRTGETVRPQDLAPGGPPATAWPMTPAAAGPKSGSRLNQILLVKLAGGEIVAYSAICTHAGCVVTGWQPQEHLFQCPCHGSEYDPAAGGKAVFGPAPRALPELPVKVADGTLTVVGGFSAHLGGEESRTD
jgi:rieske iron-sulfur protein